MYKACLIDRTSFYAFDTLHYIIVHILSQPPDDLGCIDGRPRGVHAEISPRNVTAVRHIAL